MGSNNELSDEQIIELGLQGASKIKEMKALSPISSTTATIITLNQGTIQHP